MITIGIDPGTKCGWALRGNGGDVCSGVWDLQPLRHEGGGMRFVRLRVSFSALLESAQSSGQAVAVAYEEVRRHKGVSAAHIYGGIVAVVSEVCESAGVPYAAIPVGTVKKRATGKGNANKAAMVAAAKARWPGWNGTHDEADARFVAEAMVIECAGA